MIYRIFAGFLCLFCFSSHAQVLRDINYNHRYDPNKPFVFHWKVLKLNDGYSVLYSLQKTDTTQSFNLTVALETRESISDKNGTVISHGGSGVANFNAAANQSIVVATVTLEAGSKPKTFLFHQPLPQKKSLYLNEGASPVFSSFVRVNKPVTFSGFDPVQPIQISYYSQSFPAAAPPFSSTQGKVSKTIKADSIFTVSANASQTFTKKGLYLAQQDTASTTGIAFRVEEDYPKLGKLESLVAPLIYVCTKQETEKLKQAGSDKKKFDQVILTFTGNQERARNFMRSYFRRIELANQYFSSYKEGWKTDRGMIYTIFGPPEEVYLFDEREVWEYRNDSFKARFQFAKSPTLFDPENYVLIRDKKFTDTWYEIVDLWRKARF